MRRVFQRDGLRRALPEEPLSRQPALLQSVLQAARRPLGVPGNIANKHAGSIPTKFKFTAI